MHTVNPAEYVYEEFRHLLTKDRNKYWDLYMTFQGIFDHPDTIENDLEWLEANYNNTSVVGEEISGCEVKDLIKYARECFNIK